MQSFALSSERFSRLNCKIFRLFGFLSDFGFFENFGQWKTLKNNKITCYMDINTN